jgi:integrase
MRKTRGIGSVYQPTYLDRATSERKVSAVFWIRYYHHGRKYRESSGSTVHADAVRLLKDRIARAGLGKPVTANIERTDFEALAEMLLNEYKANGRRSLKRVSQALAHLRGYFGNSRAIEMTSDRMTAYVAQRQEEGAAAATINRELAALKRSFRLASHAGRVASVPHIAMLREDNARKGFFEREQFEAVLRHLPDYLKPVMETAYATGWRGPSEILTRKKHHLDVDGGWLRLEPGESKNREGRQFPLTPKLRQILEAQIERTRELEVATEKIIPWLFHRKGEPIRNYYRAWNKACDDAGVPGRLVHDFRRTAVRNLERSGVPRSAAMKMTGHRTEAVYRRYAIVDETMLKEGGVKLAAFHESQSTEAATPKVVGIEARRAAN